MFVFCKPSCIWTFNFIIPDAASVEPKCCDWYFYIFCYRRAVQGPEVQQQSMGQEESEISSVKELEENLSLTSYQSRQGALLAPGKTNLQDFTFSYNWFFLVTLCFSFQKDFKLLITTHKVYYHGMPHCNSFTIIWPSAQKPQCNWSAKMWVYLETSFCFPAGSESLTGSRLSLNRLRDRSPSPVRTKQDRASISSCPDMVGHTVRGNWEHSLTVVFVTIQAINGDLIKVSF